MVTVLCSMLPQKINTSKKNKWNPTPQEVKEGIIVHIKVSLNYCLFKLVLELFNFLVGYRFLKIMTVFEKTFNQPIDENRSFNRSYN